MSRCSPSTQGDFEGPNGKWGTLNSALDGMIYGSNDEEFNLSWASDWAYEKLDAFELKYADVFEQMEASSCA